MKTQTTFMEQTECLAEALLADVPVELRQGLLAKPIRERLNALRIFAVAAGQPTARLQQALAGLPKAIIHVREVRNDVTGVSTYFVAEWDARQRSEQRLLTDAKDRDVEQGLLWQADGGVCGLIFTKSGVVRVAAEYVQKPLSIAEELDRR